MGIHLLAGLAILPVAQASLRERAQPAEAFAPVTIVELVHLRPPQAAAPQPQAQPPDAPRSKPVSQPEDPAPYTFALSDPESPGVAAPEQPVDDDPLYRAPFRDAVAHADARLRAGLSCAHVDMTQLPRMELDLCAAAQRLRRERG